MPFIRTGKRPKHECTKPYAFTRDPVTGVSLGHKAVWQCHECGRRWLLFEHDGYTRWWSRRYWPPRWWNKLMADMRGMYRYE